MSTDCTDGITESDKMTKQFCCLIPLSQRWALAEQRSIEYTNMRIKEICEEGNCLSTKYFYMSCQNL